MALIKNRKIPNWLNRALDVTSPMTYGSETIKLISYDNKVAPTVIRVGTKTKGKFIKLTADEAIKRANKNNTFLEFANEEQAEMFAKNFSKIIPNKNRRKSM
jgi:hypothetical protein